MHSIFLPPAGSARGTFHASLGKLQGRRNRRMSGVSPLQRHKGRYAILAVAAFCVIAILSGCGSIAGNTNEVTAGSLVASTTSLSFGDVTVGQTATASVSLKNASAVSVQVTQISVAGQYFTLTSQNGLPAAIAGGGSLSISVQFSPTAAGSAAGTLTVVSNASAGNMTLPLSGTGQTVSSPPVSQPSVSAISCNNATLTGAGTDSCSVTLSAAAGASGASVSLASDDSAVTVPATISVAANATTGTFMATAAAVSASQSATITATIGSSSATYNLQLDPLQAGGGTPSLSMSASSLAFGDVTINTQATPQYVTVMSTGSAALTINSATVSGAGFAVAGPGLPVNVAPGDAVTLQVKFDPASAGAASGTLTIATNAPAGGTAVVNLSGTGDAAAGALSTLFCNSDTIDGAGTDSCTVALSAAAPAGGLTVTLSSSSTALSVPASVTVPAGNTSTFFTATATAVTATTTANLTANSGVTSKIYAIQLLPEAPALSVSTTSLTFGDVTVNSSATQTVTLISSGSSPLTINSGTLTGTGFSMTGTTFPVTLNPGQRATLTVKFDPTAAGAATGSITITSNATSNGTVTINLSGTGDATAGTLSSLSCNQGTISGSANDVCTVTLSAAASASGQVVTLASNSGSVAVPASVTIPAGGTTAGFNATVSAVTSTTSATLSATANGVTKVFTLQLNPQTIALSLSTMNLSFGDVNVNTPSSQSVTLTSSGTVALTINAATLTGTGFTMIGANFPVTLNPGQSAVLQVTFDPTTAGAETGAILVTSNATMNPTATITLSGTGDSTAGALSALSCATSSYTAAGTDACTVTLSSAAPTGGLAVALASNNTSVTVPASVTVTAGATTAGFSATVAAVSTTQTATLTATASGVAKTVNLQLSGGTPGLSLSSSSVAFGNVDLNTPATQTVTLTSSGGAALTLGAGTLTGTGFTMTGVTFPATLNPGQTATLNLQFDPTTAGAASGLVTITSNASTGGTATIALSGTGVTTATYEVQLSWAAPTSSTDPVASYNVYRSTGGGAYQKINTAVNTPTTYTDTTVQDGVTYNYEVTSVDASGAESAPSNVYTAAIP
jgi:Abnormal spindle-like microcephaly-assoc'd, ASPM-SPD-2-Hydin